VSSQQQEHDGTSLETQEERCRRYAAEHGLTVDPRHIYRDVFSGAVLHERPKLRELRQAARTHAFDVAISYAVDRLSRNQAHLYIVAEELETAGVRVEFVTESFEDSAVGKFIRSAKSFAAEVEREKFIERSVRGKRARVGAGKLLHGKTPLYGYDWTDSTKSRYVVNPITATVVRRIFAACLDGSSIRGIAALLTADRIPTPRGAVAWDPVVVRNMLRNPAYMGEAYAFRVQQQKVLGTNRTRATERPRDEWVALPDGTVPAIVDRDAFDAAQDRLRRNLEQSPRRLRDPEQYLLRGGYARCGYCGNAMSAVKGGRRNVAHLYRCTRVGRSKGSCFSHGIAAPILDEAVWDHVNGLFTQPEVIEREIERMEQNDPTGAEAEAVEKAISGVQRKAANLVRSLTLFDDPDAAAPVVAQLEALRGQERALVAERDHILGRRAGWAAGRQRLANIKAWCRMVGARLDLMTYAQKRTALDALGVQVRVWKKDHEPRYLITAGVPLDPPGQTGQVSRLYAASQNIHSYRMLRWNTRRIDSRVRGPASATSPSTSSRQARQLSASSPSE
jgi:site-specific DNA recombinase